MTRQQNKNERKKSEAVVTPIKRVFSSFFFSSPFFLLQQKENRTIRVEQTRKHISQTTKKNKNI
jgi:hypothetical protein